MTNHIKKDFKKVVQEKIDNSYITYKKENKEND